jgi:peptidoglycan hydrolase CwlO-like protein
MNGTVSIAMLISVVSLACTLINTFAGQKKQYRENVEGFIKVNLKLDTFCGQLNELIRKSDNTAEELKKLEEKIIGHGYMIDEHEKRIEALERGRNEK